jgi:hypothetical protein
MSRGWGIALGLVALVAAVGLFVWQQRPRDSADRVTVDQVREKFRADVARDPGRLEQADGLPEPGVYRYSIHGGETLDAVQDTDHRYGGVSTITVIPSPCGVLERLQVLSGRWSQIELCPGDGGDIRVVSLHDHHEFFGVEQDTSYVCRRGAQPEESRCASGGDLISNTGKLIGTESVEVGGRSFSAFHVRTDIAISGSNSGAGRSDEWRRRSDNLLLKKEVSTDASFTEEGGGNYGERYSLLLLSTSPQR